jgi:hypothetical protein
MAAERTPYLRRIELKSAVSGIKPTAVEAMEDMR